MNTKGKLVTIYNDLSSFVNITITGMAIVKKSQWKKKCVVFQWKRDVNLAISVLKSLRYLCAAVNSCMC